VAGRITTNPFFHVLLIAVVGLLAYSNTFHASFHFDDYDNIVENPIIKELSYFTDPDKARNFSGYDIFKSRYIGSLSFALNYRLHGEDVTGYHAVNVAVHLLNSLLLYAFVLLTFRSPFLKEASSSAGAVYIAFFSALFFVAHPLQTQAVTYIVQRFASMTTTFYLASFTAYALSRLSVRGISRFVFYVLTIVMALLACKTKETAVTLPVAITIYEVFFFRDLLGRRVMRLVPVFLVILVIPFSFANMDKPLGVAIEEMSGFSKVQTSVSRWDYLVTQFRVVVTYLRLLVLPVNQNIDYNYPLYNSFLGYRVLLPFLLLAGIFSLGALFLRRSSLRPELRLVSFGVFWFFITLMPESSVLPIVDLIFEHRVYLPSVGLMMSFTTLLYAAFPGSGRRFLSATVLAVMIAVVLAALAYNRNTVWKDEVSLWKDASMKSAKGRPVNNLGLAYKESGMIEEAILAYRDAIRHEPTYIPPYVNLALEYWDMGMKDETVEVLKQAASIKPSSEAYYNLGVAYMKLERPEEALGSFRKAIVLDRSSQSAYSALGAAYLSLGQTTKAIKVLREGIGLMPGYPKMYYNLGRAYLEAGDRDAALRTHRTLEGLDKEVAAALLRVLNGREKAEE
jgi:Flp pilus assembly protein TadD